MQKAITLPLSKQQVFEACQKANQQIFTKNVKRDGNTTMFFIFEEAKNYF